MDSRSPIFVASGGVACALIFALSVASWGVKRSIPREGSVGMWCAIGLATASLVERDEYLRQATPDSKYSSGAVIHCGESF